MLSVVSMLSVISVPFPFSWAFLVPLPTRGAFFASSTFPTGGIFSVAFSITLSFSVTPPAPISVPIPVPVSFSFFIPRTTAAPAEKCVYLYLCETDWWEEAAYATFCVENKIHHVLGVLTHYINWPVAVVALDRDETVFEWGDQCLAAFISIHFGLLYDGDGS